MALNPLHQIKDRFGSPHLLIVEESPQVFGKCLVNCDVLNVLLSMVDKHFGCSHLAEGLQLVLVLVLRDGHAEHLFRLVIDDDNYFDLL